ncbi:MAG: M56 family metallopeptidase [Gemmatimonadaceae bacterium]
MRSPSWLLATLLLKPALVVAGASVMVAGLRRHTAAARHAVWAGAIIVSLALPLLSAALPPLRVPVPAALGQSLNEGGRRGTDASAAVKDLTPSDPARPSSNDGRFQRLWADGGSLGDSTGMMMFAAWVVVALLLAGRRVIAEIRVRQIVRDARSVSPRLARVVADVAQASGVHGRLQVRLSSETTSPAAAGVLRAVVLLPADAERWAESDLRPVLAHELGHVTRRDCLLNVFADVASIVYWCNPVLLLAVRQMRTESERACDNMVLRGGAHAETYADLLLRFAGGARLAGALPSAATAMTRPSQLESRLIAVLDPRVPRVPPSRWMTGALAGLSAVLAIPAAALTLRAAPLAAMEQMAGEPDRRADSVAAPASERLPLPAGAYAVSAGARLALAGPDSILATHMVAALGHQPAHEADLVRERAAWTLAQARDGRLVEPLLEALDARDWRVQSYAAWALGTARDARAVPQLVPLLGHPVWRLRAMAAYALRESRDPRAQVAMTAALTDDAWQVRVEAVKYFAALGGRAHAAHIRPRLNDRHVAVRLAAERAIAFP